MKQKKNKIALAMVAIIAIGAYSTFGCYYEGKGVDNILNENVLALSEGSNDWFASLDNVSCPITRVNGAAVIVVGEYVIPAYATYTVYGTRKECCFSLFGTCDVSQQTTCQSNKWCKLSCAQNTLIPISKKRYFNLLCKWVSTVIFVVWFIKWFIISCFGEFWVQILF